MESILYIYMHIYTNISTNRFQGGSLLKVSCPCFQKDAHSRRNGPTAASFRPGFVFRVFSAVGTPKPVKQEAGNKTLSLREASRAGLGQTPVQSSFNHALFPQPILSLLKKSELDGTSMV